MRHRPSRIWFVLNNLFFVCAGLRGRTGFSLVAESRHSSIVGCADVPLMWLLLWNVGSSARGFQ